MEFIEYFAPIMENEELEEHDLLFPNRHGYNTGNRYRHADLFNKYNEEEFIARFRLSKNSVRFLLELTEQQLQPASNRNNPISPMAQLLVTLPFYATGSFYITISDFGKMHRSTTAKIIYKVSTILCALGPQFIKMPMSEQEKMAIKTGFHNIARFPRVIGAVDGTHIRIYQSLGGPEAENYRNRKGYFSINVQAVANANNYLQDVVARWPDAAHDSNIFDNSRVRMIFENGNMGHGLLLGDSGYPLRSYIITPVVDPRTDAENLFNEAHIRIRNVVEKTFGIWKRRFPILSIGFRCNVRLMQKIITATAVLHNIALDREDPLPDGYDELDLDNIHDNYVHNARQNDRVRRDLIEYFSNL